MLKKEISEILAAFGKDGWVPEPEAKRLLSLAGIPVARHRWAKSYAEALHFAEETGWPVVAKVVSSALLHKSDQGGVVVGIGGPDALKAAYERFRAFTGFAGVMVEEMLTGVELILGAKMDYQFGPVILFGMGGTRAEIYRDVILRMAPLDDACIGNMVRGLRAHALLEGFRGEAPVNLPALSAVMSLFSGLVLEMEQAVDSVDINPLICNAERCVVADARIMLKGG